MTDFDAQVFDPSQVDPQVCFAVVNAAVAKARRFFRVPDEFESFVFDNAVEGYEDAPMTTVIDHAYLKQEIYVNTPRIGSYALAWAYAAHEVAHVQAREVLQFVETLNAEQQEQARDAIERLTVRLERLFVASHPYPGDDAFRGAS